MLLDGVIILIVTVFTVLDWCLGLVRDWTVPVSMVIATLISQHFYVDLATVLAETLHLKAPFAVFIAYLLVWLGIAQYSDTFLSHIFKSSDNDPPLYSKIGGAFLGFIKGSMAFVLAAMVTYAHNKVPEPPKVSSENGFLVVAVANSHFLPTLHNLARELDEPIGKYVLSADAPRFKANFALGNDPLAPIMEKEREKGYKVGSGYRKFEKSMEDIESKIP